jgi:hypothetical protein
MPDSPSDNQPQPDADGDGATRVQSDRLRRSWFSSKKPSANRHAKPVTSSAGQSLIVSIRLLWVRLA